MIHFCSNSTGWGPSGLVLGGQVDRLIAPIIQHLPPGSYSVGRQPVPRAVNVYLSNRDRYRAGSQRMDRVSVSYAHGIASKGYRRWERTSSFTYVTCPGPAHAREVIASGAPSRRVVQIGYPKLDPLFCGEVPSPVRDDRIRVLYAPTHGGGSEYWREGNRQAPGAKATSWWQRNSILRLLDPATFDVVLCPHPRHAAGHQATFAQYVGADVVIADGGSTIYEAMALGLPVVLTTWLTKDRNLSRQGGQLLEARVYRDRLGVHVDTPEQLEDAVVAAAEQGLGDRERTFMQQVLPQRFRGTSGAVFAAWLLNLDKEKDDGDDRRVQRAAAI